MTPVRHIYTTAGSSTLASNPGLTHPDFISHPQGCEIKTGCLRPGFEASNTPGVCSRSTLPAVGCRSAGMPSTPPTDCPPGRTAMPGGYTYRQEMEATSSPYEVKYQQHAMVLYVSIIINTPKWF